MPWMDRHAPAEARAEAHTAHAQVLARLNHNKQTAKERRRVLAIAALPSERAEQWNPSARDALAEVRFALAEQKREAASLVTLPPYRRKGDRESVMTYLNDKVQPWLPRHRY